MGRSRRRSAFPRRPSAFMQSVHHVSEGQNWAHAEREMIPPIDPRRSFFLVPFVATAIWYLVMLGALAVGNGRLRWKPDVLAMALGAVVIGFPTAVAITLVFAVPAYLLVRRVREVTLASAVIGGGLIGVASWVLYWALTGESDALSPVRAPLIGMLTGGVWCYLGGRPATR